MTYIFYFSIVNTPFIRSKNPCCKVTYAFWWPASIVGAPGVHPSPCSSWLGGGAEVELLHISLKASFHWREIRAGTEGKDLQGHTAGILPGWPVCGTGSGTRFLCNLGRSWHPSRFPSTWWAEFLKTASKNTVTVYATLLVVNLFKQFFFINTRHALSNCFFSLRLFTKWTNSVSYLTAKMHLKLHMRRLWGKEGSAGEYWAWQGRAG